MYNASFYSAVLALALLSGCAGTTVTYPYCPVPVMLSRTDRIGAQGSPAAIVVRPLTASTDAFRVAAGGRNSSFSARDDVSPGMLTAEVLGSLPTGHLVETDEVRVEGVRLETSSGNTLFGLSTEAKGVPRADYVRVGGAP